MHWEHIGQKELEEEKGRISIYLAYNSGKDPKDKHFEIYVSGNLISPFPPKHICLHFISLCLATNFSPESGSSSVLCWAGLCVNISPF